MVWSRDDNYKEHEHVLNKNGAHIIGTDIVPVKAIQKKWKEYMI